MGIKASSVILFMIIIVLFSVVAMTILVSSFSIKQNKTSISTVATKNIISDISSAESSSQASSKEADNSLESSSQVNSGNVDNSSSSEKSAESKIEDNAVAVTYKGETITNIYALNTKEYATVKGSLQPIENEKTSLAELLENYVSSENITDKAFIIFTDSGKREYIYLENNAPRELLKCWDNMYEIGKNHKNIHWLTHMTTDKIVEIKYSGMSFDGKKDVGITTNDKVAIKEISEFLKNSITVKKTERVSNHQSNPSTVMGCYTLTIKFDTGVSYQLMGYGDYGKIDEGGSGLGIYSSDVGATVEYTCNEGIIKKLREFMENLEVSTVNSVVFN
ncbi:MAG: hypothetical protein RR839_03840 [Oscillospiraceae bacterium]